MSSDGQRVGSHHRAPTRRPPTGCPNSPSRPLRGPVRRCRRARLRRRAGWPTTRSIAPWARNRHLPSPWPPRRGFAIGGVAEPSASSVAANRSQRGFTRDEGARPEGSSMSEGFALLSIKPPVWLPHWVRCRFVGLHWLWLAPSVCVCAPGFCFRWICFPIHKTTNQPDWCEKNRRSDRLS